MVIYEVHAVSTVNVYATVYIIVYYVKCHSCLVTKEIHFWGRCFEIPYMYVLAKITTNIT